MFDLLPIYDREAIFSVFWALIQKGLDKISDRLKGNADTKEVILNNLLSGRLLLWIVFIDGKYEGFVTTQIQEREELFINHLYLQSGVKEDILIQGESKLIEYAKKVGCSRLSGLTTRKGFIKKLQWKTGATIVFKEI